MDSLEPKGVPYAKYKPRLEILMDFILYNPWFQQQWQKQMDTGFWYARTKAIKNLFEVFFPTHFGDYNLNFIGVSHTDAAWKWTKHDTIIRVFKTFKKAIEHIERYPFFTFTQTSAQYYQWIKDLAPALWEVVKKNVKEGRIELAGGMWVEPDLNMSSGEALVRQRLYGMNFFLREFGQMPRVESLLDIFGFPQQIPQILVKSGAEAFWTTKCTWNDTTMWPFANYFWEAQDGSRIFTHHFKFNMMAFIDLDLYKEMARYPKPEAIGKRFSSKHTLAEIDAALQPDYYPRLGIFYGWGDGALGPLEVEIGAMQLLCQAGYGKMTSFHNYFDILRRELKDEVVVWADEMYLEIHRGCLTTNVKIKRLNRLAEYSFFNLEMLLTILNLGATYTKETKYAQDAGNYQQTLIYKLWQRVLFNQFHDILPGSSVEDVYLKAFAELEFVIRHAKILTEFLLGLHPEAETKTIVFNPSSWARSEKLYKDGKWYKIPALPGLSITALSLKEYELKIHSSEPDVTLHQTNTSWFLENNALQATFSKKTGNLKSLRQKQLDKECLYQAVQGGRLRAFDDEMPLFKAWNIDKEYFKKPYEISLVSITGNQKSANGYPEVEQKVKFGKSTASIRYQLRSEEEMLRVKIDVDIRNGSLFLKYFVPINCSSFDVVSDAPYGHVIRNRNPKSELDQGKWEISMQKWIDISDLGFGVAILNKDRYAATPTKQGLYISLLRSSEYTGDKFHSYTQFIPRKQRQKYVDLGQNSFELAIYPHKGDWKTARPWQKGEEYNNPLLWRFAPHHNAKTSGNPIQNSSILTQFPEITPIRKAKLQDNHAALKESLFTLNSPNLILTAIKPLERMDNDLVEPEDYEWDGQSIIVRIVEFEGIDGVGQLEINDHYQINSAEAVDLLERTSGDLKEWNSKALSFNYGHNSINTFKILIQKRNQV